MWSSSYFYCLLNNFIAKFNNVRFLKTSFQNYKRWREKAKITREFLPDLSTRNISKHRYSKCSCHSPTKYRTVSDALVFSLKGTFCSKAIAKHLFQRIGRFSYPRRWGALQCCHLSKPVCCLVWSCDATNSLEPNTLTLHKLVLSIDRVMRF